MNHPESHATTTCRAQLDYTTVEREVIPTQGHLTPRNESEPRE